MDNKIRAGMRVLYKYNNSNWLVGETAIGTGILNQNGLFIPISSKEEIEKAYAEGYTWDQLDPILININDIFFDAIKLDDWMKDNLVRKEDYVKIIQEEDFEKNLENAWFSDGEYYYYPVSKFSESWIMRQPLDYVIRGS